MGIKNNMALTGMEQYQEWYEILEEAGFKRVVEEIGDIGYQHPKKPDYRIYFDWMTFKVACRATIVFRTNKLDLGTIDAVIHAIKWPKTAGDILKGKKPSL